MLDCSETKHRTPVPEQGWILPPKRRLLSYSPLQQKGHRRLRSYVQLTPKSGGGGTDLDLPKERARALRRGKERERENGERSVSLTLSSDVSPEGGGE